MAKYSVADIRNIALVGHGATGKTSLTDAMLYKAGAVDRLGSVDEGTSVTDFDELEKERKFSIDPAFAHAEYQGRQLHFIDTPGYPDFVGGALASLYAVETAVIVVSASAGIQVNTRRMFNEAGRKNLARIFVINKLDADNIDFDQVVSALQSTFGNRCVLFNVPIGIGPELSGVCSVLNPPNDAPANALRNPNEIRSQLVDSIVESDEELMEKYLETGEVSAEELQKALPNALASGTVIPIFCTCARKDVGIKELLDGLAAFSPSPVIGPKRKGRRGDEEVVIEPTAEGDAVGQVWKQVHDKFVGTLSYIRLFSGTIKADQQLYNARTGKSARTSGLLLMQGKNSTNISEAIAGDIFAVAKVEGLQIGDTVGTSDKIPILPPIEAPTPMFGLAVEPKSRGDEQKISGSLAKIADEDITFRVTRDPQTKELVITGMSQLHLDVIQERLRRRFQLEVTTKEPKIPYRETITSNAEASYRHKKQSGGRGQFGEVHLRVYPFPRKYENAEQVFAEYLTKDRFEKIRLENCYYDPENNFVFIDTIVGGSIPNQFIPAVRKGCEELMERGALAGYRMQDLAVEVFFGKDHPVDSSETAFRIAGRQALKKAVQQANPVLLEPIVDLEVTIPAKDVGTILGDLNTKRARIESQESLPGDLMVIRCKVPLAEVARYAAQLGSMTQGQGSYTMDFSHYDIVPPNVQQQIVAKAQLEEEEED